MSNGIALAPNTKILLDAMAALQQVPQSTVVERALFTFRDSLDPEDRETLERFCGRAVRHREKQQNRAARSSAGNPKVTYDSSRFCFKRDRIDGLDPTEQFRMITPVGVFQMSKADFYREFPNVVASASYKAGVYNYPRLPSKAEQFRTRDTTMLDVKRQYEQRIRELLDGWREACVAAGWPTAEIQTGFEELPTKHPVYRWYFEAKLPQERGAHIQVLTESETDAEEDGGFHSVVNCFASIGLGLMGSDHVRWDVPSISVLLDDTQAFEEKFQVMEQVHGATVVDAIKQHLEAQR
jgi:hypothetical protein